MRRINKLLTHHIIRRSLLFLFIMLSFSPGMSIFATSNENVNIKNGGLSILTEGTCEHLSVGTSFGLNGTITNNTNSTIYINERTTTLKVPAEIEGPYSTSDAIWYGYLPAANHGVNRELNYKAPLALGPNESTSVFWLVNPRNTLSIHPTGAPDNKPNLLTALRTLYDQLIIELHFLFFSPGKYNLSISINYWDNSNYIGNHNNFTENKFIEVAAPQSVILFGAAIGGLIAYVIIPNSRRDFYLPRFSLPFFYVTKYTFGILGAMLFSAIITILLSRIAESQFLIRVTVSDLWGAIAIGFIANYIGREALSKMINSSSTSTTTKTDPAN